MTDAEQTIEEVTEQTSEKAVKKATKKATQKVAEPLTEKVTEQVAESVSKEDKRTKLANKLKAMGMMPGSKGAASSSDAIPATSSKLVLPSWLSPQLLVLVAGAGIFTLLIWSLEQEKQPISQQLANPAQQATPQAMPGRPAYPAQAYYPYPYGYHPAMQFGFNGYAQGRGAPSYYAYPQRPPAYGYAPYGRARGYRYPPPQAGQR